MSALKRALAFTATLSLLLTNGRVVHAFPTQPVIDSFWSSSMPWIVIPSRGNGTLSLQVSLNTPDCNDPVASRNAPASAMCPSAATRDVIVHVFTEGVGTPNEVLAWRCQSAACPQTIALPATASQRIALMVHGGPIAVGLQSGSITWDNGTSSGTSSLSLAGNIMVDVSNPPATNYDAESVLMPDVGNLPNDDLGADVTEVWMLREDFHVVRADIEGSGVGDAGRIARAATPPTGSTDVVRWALARPARPLPFQLRTNGTSATEWSIPAAAAPPPLDPNALTNTGRMRLILNARYGSNDADYDGLSNAVEQALGTCDGLSPFPSTGASNVRCTLWSSFTATNNPTEFLDPRDTDGDGLSDGAEVLGSDVSYARDVNNLGVGLSTTSSYSGVGETFPRWGFNPLHKDILVEVDLGIALSNCTQAEPRRGCEVDTVGGQPVVIPQRLTPGDTAVWPLADWMNSLRVWHDRYAVIPASRANNPDGADGIRVHFDIRAASVATNGHGTRPAFNPFPSNTGASARPGLIAYIPGNEVSGSSCSCGGVMNGPAPRHGGYATLATLTTTGGGQSLPGGYVVGGLQGGDVPAHEHGHYLGLDHGGPDRRNGSNPFAPRVTNGTARQRRVDHDLDRTAKLVHDSLMSYFFAPKQPFSLGARAFTPLPREVGGVFGYPEVSTFSGTNTFSVQYWRNPQGLPQPRACSGPGNEACTDVDFNLDGVASGLASTALVEAPGHWRGGVYRRIELLSYWCTSEQFAQDQNFCCANSLRPNNAARFCPDNSTPAQPPTPATWLLSGQPAAFIGENRAYAVFVDDDGTGYGATGAVVRTRTVSNSTAPNGILRWAALDGFVRGADEIPSDCFGVQGCPGTPTGPVVGAVNVDNYPVAIDGTTGISAATYRADVDLRRVTVLGWTSRNTRNCGVQAACDNAWLAPRFAITRASNVESGFTSFTLPGSAPQLTRASSVAIAAWDPTFGGQDRGFTVLLRGAVDPYPVRLYTCYSWSEAPSSIVCTDQGDLWEFDGTTYSPVRAHGSIAAAIDHPTSGAPSLYLARTQRLGVQPSGRFQIGLTRLRSVSNSVWVDGPITPTQSNPFDHIPSVRDASISMTIVPTSGLVGADVGGRMLISWEYAGGDWMSRPTGTAARLASRGGIPRQGFSGFLFEGFDTSGPPTDTPMVLAGSNDVTLSSRPGHVDALFFDDRSGPAVRGADTALDAFLVRRARGFHVDMEQGGVMAEFFGIDEPYGHQVAKFSFEETQTLAYYTCQHTGWNQLEAMTNQASVHRFSRGWDVYLNAATQGVTPIPLRCPAASNWIVNNAALSNTVPTLGTSELNSEALTTEMLLTIADFINRPNVFASTTDPPPTPPTPPAIHYDTYCYAENPSAVYAQGHAPGTPP